MKRSGIIRSHFHGEYAFELHRTERPFRWEIRLHRGAVHSFLLGWLIVSPVDDLLATVTLTPALGITATSIGPIEYRPSHETLIAIAVDRWQTLLAEKQKQRKAG